MRSYILAIVGAVLISAVVTMISPGGKTGKFVKGAMKLFLIVVLIAPFVNFFQSGKFSVPKESELAEDRSYYIECAELIEQSDEEEIAALLRELFGVEASAEVTRSPDAGFSLKKIAVKISDFGISGQVEHKDITDRVQAFLREKYGIAAEVS